MINKECIFCNEEDIGEGLLYQSDNFFIRAAVRGAISPGHVLLISKKHLSCFGAMTEDLDVEYSEVLNKTFDKVANSFSLPILIEQGIHGQSVEHAHLHFAPAISPWYDFTKTKLKDYIPQEIKVESAHCINDVRRIFKEDGQYVTIQQDEHLIYRTRGYNGTLRALRSIATEITGRKDLYDWRTVTPKVAEENKKWVMETIDKLREQ